MSQTKLDQLHAAEIPLLRKVKQVMDDPGGYPWSVQGLGMARLILTPDRTARLHVWLTEFAVDASLTHTHPWWFKSLVLAGKVVNIRYRDTEGLAGVPYWRQRLLCGEGGGPIRGEPELTTLLERSIETHMPWDSYRQTSDEVHVSDPDDGTVTLVERQFMGDRDHALAYWPEDEEWKSAEPRPATDEEIELIAGVSLVRKHG